MRRKWIISVAALFALTSSGLALSAASATPDASAEAAARATVKVAQSSKLGRYLVDGRGRTLYLFVSDSPGAIACTSDNLSCTTLWPPFRTSAKPVAGPGVNKRLLGTVRRRKPAGVQVTYNRRPLYFYSSDVKAGDTTGQGQFGLWYVVSPAGKAIKK